MMRNGKPHGEGVIRGRKSCFNGTFFDGDQKGLMRGSATLPNGVDFEGNVLYKDLNGPNIFDLATVSDKKPILNGTFTLTNGSEIIGNLAEGKLNGQEAPFVEFFDRPWSFIYHN